MKRFIGLAIMSGLLLSISSSLGLAQVSPPTSPPSTQSKKVTYTSISELWQSLGDSITNEVGGQISLSINLTNIDPDVMASLVQGNQTTEFECNQCVSSISVYFEELPDRSYNVQEFLDKVRQAVRTKVDVTNISVVIGDMPEK